jgi:hypothetical protein
MILAKTPDELANRIEERLRSTDRSNTNLGGTIFSNVSWPQIQMIVEALRLLASQKPDHPKA